MLENWKKIIITASLSGLSLGCAGPATPFGAVSIFKTQLSKSFGLGRDVASLDRSPQIKFEPLRQVLHSQSDFTVAVEDPEGIPFNYEFLLWYNGFDVTDQFLRQADISFYGNERRRMELKIKNFRLLPTRNHLISVLYRRSANDKAIVFQYLPPECPLTAPDKQVKRLPEFEPSNHVIRNINTAATSQNLNPFLLAGLIAQESSFNPWAVSPARALGLTQITSLAEASIFEKYSDWPRYPELNNMSYLELKLGVLDGSLNENNEWRLNPEYSVLGGAEYVNYLVEYWSRPEKRALITPLLKQREGLMSEVILASYNSGAARVTQALERRGVDWLYDVELYEARRYVKRVMSYCDSFESYRE